MSQWPREGKDTFSSRNPGGIQYALQSWRSLCKEWIGREALDGIWENISKPQHLVLGAKGVFGLFMLYFVPCALMEFVMVHWVLLG